MSGLTAAHRGYEYQDLLVACRLVDMLLGTVVRAHIDEKLLPGDRFDDLTTMDISGHRERIQFKYTDNNYGPLTLATFTNDNRGLRLDHLIAAILADRSGPGSNATCHRFRVILRDQPPIDPRLTAVLVPAIVDPGPFIPTMLTIRLAFDVEALWARANHKVTTDTLSDEDHFAFLASGERPVSQADLYWACQHLIIEVAAPTASGDLTTPEAAELLLLARVRTDVGAEAYPNLDRSAIDVASAMIGTARAARQARLIVSADELLRRAQLRHDFGAVSRAHPVDRSVEVPRAITVRQLADSAADLASSGGRLLVVGPPGQGKSWVCQQLLGELSRRGWLTAEHYCYLGDADGDRLARVLAEAVFGSLISRLADADPRLVTDQRPRFAADEDALVNCVARSLQDEPQRLVALVVDGIDHITRVRSGGGNFDPSLSLAEALGFLALPAGSVLIVLSQPGAHLRPLEEAGATTLPIPGLDDTELHFLAARLRVVPPIDATSQSEKPLLEAEDAVAEFLPVLAERSAGNALYATYLCREALRHDATLADPAAAVRSFPPFDGSLENYYQHLHTTLGTESGWVADVIALVDFAVSRSELREIRPDAAHHVDKALKVLAPVLVERVAQGGVRIYHESFARFLRRPFQGDHLALSGLLGRISTWLEKKGFFTDSRAFRSLLPTLAEAGQDVEVVALVERDFVVRAVAAGFPASSINRNLATAIGSAARIQNWPAVVRYIELSRAADTYESERFDSTLVQFADIPMKLLGPDVVADRLLYDDRLVMPARAGLQMCAAVDALGAVAPWRHYMTGYLRETKSDNTSYGAESDQKVSLAWLRGWLRLSASSEPIENDSNFENDDVVDEAKPNESQVDLLAPMHWSRFARRLERSRLPASAVAKAVLDTYGVLGVTTLINMLDQPGDMCLALAEWISVAGAADSANSAKLWATTAATYGTRPGTAHRLLALGVDLSDLAQLSVSEARSRLLSLTRKIQQRSIRWDSGNIDEWLDACAIAVHQDSLGLNAAEALIVGEGWYRCWLRFVIGLARAEAADVADQSRLAVDAVRYLTEDLAPFSGDPRSCDLYPIHGVIEDTIRRAVALVDDHGWQETFALLREVSNSITRAIHREMGGPLPPDLLLRIAVDGVSQTRQSAAMAFVTEEIERGAAGRYYADLAEYRLLGARLALTSDNREGAARLWIEACEMLTAYGWRKDITIYELLDPLPILISVDPARGRACVARAQPVCERVPLHTDGKGTRQARERWWKLLAKADPVNLAHLVANRLLRECNDSNWLLHGALEDLWRTWQDSSDPVIAGALRLTLDTPLEPKDPQALARLEDGTEGVRGNRSELMTLLLARADERPVGYSYSNSKDLLARDDEHVAQLNLVAQRSNLPRVVAVRELYDETVQPRPSYNEVRQPSFISRTRPVAEVVPCFPPGTVGLAHAVRAWRSRPYGTPELGWAVDRYANIIGYRMIELAATGREEEAIAALRSLSRASRFEDQSGILLPVAQGLERYNHRRLAAIAYTLAWTRTRGSGGWVAFGGETEVNSLHRATELDRAVALSVVADEIQQTVAGQYGTYGLSRAVIYGFAAGALISSSTSSVDMAFAAWDEAFAIIASRAPRVHPSDDPDDPYAPPNPDDGATVTGDLDTALALGALAGLAHPAREKKRRTLLAAQLLLSERPSQAALAFDTALAALSDPATLTWLLRVIELADEPHGIAVVTCQKTLMRLATKPYLTVRALARRLLLGTEPPLPPPAPADKALVDEVSVDLWTPSRHDSEPEQPRGLEGLLDSVAGSRLGRAETMLPGLRDAVRARLAVTIVDKDYKKRLNAQLEAFANRVEHRWPDAYLAKEQTVEETLQLVATGGRAARILTGRPITDPIRWEDTLATELLDDPMLPLMIEARRQPRPPIPLPPGLRHAIWSDIRLVAAGLNQHGTVAAAVEHAETLAATVAIEPPDTAAVMTAGRFRHWRAIASVETRVIRHPDRREHRDLIAKRCRVMEVRSSGDQQALTLPPVTAGDIRLWSAAVDGSSSLRLRPRSRSYPIIGLDDDVTAMGDGYRGLGVPTPFLCPTPWLIANLGLYPGEPFILDTEDGPGLALVIWRAEYDTSEYYLTRPLISGAAILIRQDLLDQLCGVAEDDLCLRDFVSGDSDLSLTES